MTENDIYENGVALLEEWEDVNYCEHRFKFKDKYLSDEEVVDLLNELNDENKELKEQLSEFDFLKDENKHMRTVLQENKTLKKELKQIQRCIMYDYY